MRVGSRIQLLQGNFPPSPVPTANIFGASFWWGTADGAQVYAILDEVFLAGEIEETSKEKVLMRLEHLDKLE